MNRDDIIRMALEVGLPHWYEDNTLVNESRVLKFAAIVAAAERDACAKVCDDWAKTSYLSEAKSCARIIRARENT